MRDRQIPLPVTLRKLPRSDRQNYGFLPPRFFNQVLDAFDWYKGNRRRITPRE